MAVEVVAPVPPEAAQALALDEAGEPHAQVVPFRRRGGERVRDVDAAGEEEGGGLPRLVRLAPLPCREGARFIIESSHRTLRSEKIRPSSGLAGGRGQSAAGAMGKTGETPAKSMRKENLPIGKFLICSLSRPLLI